MDKLEYQAQVRKKSGLAQRRRMQALDLRLSGKSYREIAGELGISLARSHALVEEALDGFLSPRVDALRAEETARLDAATSAIWSRVLDGDIAAINTLVRLSERRARLHGLDAATRIEHVGGVLDQLVASLGLSAEMVAGVIRAAVEPVNGPQGGEGDVIEGSAVELPALPAPGDAVILGDVETVEPAIPPGEIFVEV